MRKHSDGPTAHAVIHQLLQVFRIVSIGHDEIADALNLGYRDFEDAVQMAAAMHAHADDIATRNLRHFSEGLVTVLEPATLAALLHAQAG